MPGCRRFRFSHASSSMMRSGEEVAPPATCPAGLRGFCLAGSGFIAWCRENDPPPGLCKIFRAFSRWGCGRMTRGRGGGFHDPEEKWVARRARMGEPSIPPVITMPEKPNPSGCSSAWLERYVRDVEVAGSNPVTPTKAGFIAFPCFTSRTLPQAVASMPSAEARSLSPAADYRIRPPPRCLLTEGRDGRRYGIRPRP